MTNPGPSPLAPPRRAPTGLRRLARSLKFRMVLLFLLLATAMTFVFVTGAQKAFSLGWREAARPLLQDYVDHLAAEVTGGGAGPRLERAQALVRRLPLTLRIDGPVLQWDSHPGQRGPDWLRDRTRAADGGEDAARAPLLQRTTADGHRLSFGVDGEAFERRPRLFGVALLSLLLLTAAAWLYARHLLKPLDAIGEGARRFGAGDFSRPILAGRRARADELGELAATIDTMGEDIRRMLDAKRSMLLAISHELRSPITRARLHAELLPEDGEAAPHREALLRDLQEMSVLVGDLLESERLATPHAALARAPTDLAGLAHEVVRELGARHAAAAAVTVEAAADLPRLSLDAARLKLLLRNLLDNALRHAADAPVPPRLRLSPAADGGIALQVRDHGPGVPEDQLGHLADPFWRPDAARSRAAGGVGLGLTLCRQVATAHGGTLGFRAAHPGLQVDVHLPPHAG